MEQEIRFCNASDGVRIAYALSGRGAPLVRVPNFLSHVAFEWKSPVWDHWWTELSCDRTLIRYDGRGCGLSDWTAGHFSLDAWLQDLEAVVDDLGLERFPLLGLFQGGAVAIAYAAKHPERVSHLILHGSYARGKVHQGGQAEEAETMLRAIRIGWGRDNPAFRQIYTTLFIPDGTPEQTEWFNELQRVATTPEIAAANLATSYRLDVSELAKQVRAPTLIFHAQDDAAAPFEEGCRLASLIPNARFVPLPSRNHILLAEEPAWQQFLSEARNFLAERQATEPVEDRPTFPDLTPRQQEVLELIAQGLDNARIASTLVISPATLRNHITQIFRKLDVADRAQAIVLAREAGMGRQEAGSIWTSSAAAQPLEDASRELAYLPRQQMQSG